MTALNTFSYDVLVIGAGGAGMRAAIEAAGQGVSVGLICKSLLGKAHTVIAEGGMAAAMGNVDDRDNWQVHFADTMRGGQYVNNWRMAEIHAKEAPDRVRELEAWGAVFDRTPDGRILQRNFGGHRYPRLAHVGDRTGLELIRTLQDHTVYLGVTVHMEHTVIELLMDLIAFTNSSKPDFFDTNPIAPALIIRATRSASSYAEWAMILVAGNLSLTRAQISKPSFCFKFSMPSR
jgi:succinate dehydrogenase / fumarate reductase flavoprotein subunit